MPVVREYIRGDKRYRGFDNHVPGADIIALVGVEGETDLWALEDTESAVESLFQYYSDLGVNSRLVGVYIRNDSVTSVVAEWGLGQPGWGVRSIYTRWLGRI